MSKKTKKIVEIIAIALCVICFIASLGNSSSKKEILDYSEAQQMIIERKIEYVEVYITSRTIYLYESKDYEEDNSSILNASGPKDSKEKTYKTIIPDISTFSEFMEEQRKEGNDVSYKIVDETSSLGTKIVNIFLELLISILPMIIILLLMKKIMFNPTGENDDYSSSSSKITFDDVAGIDQEKEEVEEVVSFLKNPKAYTKLGARIPKGILLVGEPGTGKTLLAKAIAGEAGVPFYSCTGSNFENTYVGVGASRVRKLFKKAKETAPCIIFIDEIDSVAHKRYSLNSHNQQTLNQLLGEMDGFTGTENVIVIAATNYLEVLDPAITRPGRFDRIINISLPDKKARQEIIEVHSRNKKFGDNKDIIIDELAKKTSGMSGADLENILNESAIIAIRQSHEFITESDIDEAFIKHVLGVEKGSKEISKYEKELTAVHEAGHTITSRVSRRNVEILQVSITPRGKAGGYTLFADREKSLLQQEDLKNDIIVSLGGRAAEEIILETVSIGAISDLKSATKLAHSMIYNYGMGSDTPLVRIYGEEEYNSRLEAKMFPAMEEIVANAYKEAKKVIEDNETVLTQLKEKLMEKSTLDSSELEELFSQFGI